MPTRDASTTAAGVPIPRYFQIKETIREFCASAEPNQLLPSEMEFCTMYHASRTTVRKALEQLTQEGILYRIQGKGTFIAPPKVGERFVQRPIGMHQDMEARGFIVKTAVLEQQVLPASRMIAAELHLNVGSPVIKLLRVRSIGDSTLLSSTTYLSARSFPELEHEALQDTSLYAVLNRKYGVQVGHVNRVIEADISSDEDVTLLKLSSPIGILVIRSTMFDTLNSVIETSISRLRGDRNQIEIIAE